MMNETFTAKIRKSGLSLYRISKDTGIPYSTISELARGKIDINRCASDTVLKLALYLGCRESEIMNPVQLLSGMSGKYRKVAYEWKEEDGQVSLYIQDRSADTLRNHDDNSVNERRKKEKKIRLDTGSYTQVRFYEAYKKMTECLIDVYLEDREAQALL